MLNGIILSVVMLNATTLLVFYECHYPECHPADCCYDCHYRECHHAECCHDEFNYANVIIASVIILNAIILNAIILNAIILNAILLNVVAPNWSSVKSQ